MNKAKLKKIINLAIEQKDYNKLRYIGQSLDVMMFLNKYKNFYDLFNLIENVLFKKNIPLLGKLDITNYKDLDEIGLFECKTFRL